MRHRSLPLHLFIFLPSAPFIARWPTACASLCPRSGPLTRRRRGRSLWLQVCQVDDQRKGEPVTVVSELTSSCFAVHNLVCLSVCRNWLLFQSRRLWETSPRRILRSTSDSASSRWSHSLAAAAGPVRTSLSGYFVCSLHRKTALWTQREKSWRTGARLNYFHTSAAINSDCEVNTVFSGLQRAPEYKPHLLSFLIILNLKSAHDY